MNVELKPEHVEITPEQRLSVIKHISHPEEYYKQAFKGKGIDIAELTHEEICAGVAAMKAVEADIIIYSANHLPERTPEEWHAAVDSLIGKGW